MGRFQIGDRSEKRARIILRPDLLPIFLLTEEAHLFSISFKSIFYCPCCLAGANQQADRLFLLEFRGVFRFAFPTALDFFIDPAQD